jgi:hypothetical protein
MVSEVQASITDRGTSAKGSLTPDLLTLSYNAHVGDVKRGPSENRNDMTLCKLRAPAISDLIGVYHS